MGAMWANKQELIIIWCSCCQWHNVGFTWSMQGLTNQQVTVCSQQDCAVAHPAETSTLGLHAAESTAGGDEVLQEISIYNVHMTHVVGTCQVEHTGTVCETLSSAPLQQRLCQLHTAAACGEQHTLPASSCPAWHATKFKMQL